MTDKGTVFTVKFACDNCGKEWSEEFHEKVRVWRVNSMPPSMGRTRIHPGRPSYIMVSDTREEKRVEIVMDCPNCKADRDVKIVQRIPIEERKTID